MFMASQSKPTLPMTKTSAVTELPWKSYILFRSLSLDKLMRVCLFPGRKYLTDRELYSKFHISANFNLRSLKMVSRLISTACASPPVYDIDPSSFVTNSPPDWQINISFPLAIVKNFRLKQKKKKQKVIILSIQFPIFIPLFMVIVDIQCLMMVTMIIYIKANHEYKG